MRKFLSLSLIFIVFIALIWNTISTILVGFDSRNTPDTRILQEIAGWGEILVAIILLGVFVLLARRKF